MRKLINQTIGMAAFAGFVILVVYSAVFLSSPGRFVIPTKEGSSVEAGLSATRDPSFVGMTNHSGNDKTVGMTSYRDTKISL